LKHCPCTKSNQVDGKQHSDFMKERTNSTMI
jgi:hypothetical protein